MHLPPKSCSFAVPILLVLLLSAFTHVNAQTSPFEKYRFEEGGYTFAAIFSHHDDHALQKKLGEFYIDDIAVLNQLKKTWLFTRPQKDYACGYHYEFLVLRNGSVLDSLVVNLECNQLRTSSESLFFDLKKLTSLEPTTKKLRAEEKQFSTVTEARSYLEKARSLPGFMYARPPRWIEFEGEFQFRTKCPTAVPNCFMEFEKIKPTLEKEIVAQYPGEKLSIDRAGGSSNGELFVRVRSNKTLSDRFDLYDRWNREGFGRWEPYYLGLRLYFAEGLQSSY